MLTGIFPPLPTPFTQDGTLDLDALRSNVEQLNPIGLSGYLALGSNSEAVHVTPEEASQVYATVCAAAAPGKIRSPTPCIMHQMQLSCNTRTTPQASGPLVGHGSASRPSPRPTSKQVSHAELPRKHDAHLLASDA